MGTLPLFTEPPSFDTDRLRRRLSELAQHGVFIGTSSWKYEGWLGQVYTPDRYYSRGRFSQKLFQETCLAEYAETFQVVCGDFSFYQFPEEAFWRKLFGAAGPNLKFAFKVPEEITAKAFPKHPRYGAQAGLDNPSFLDAAIFQANFLDLLRPYRDRIAVLIFEFGTFPKYTYPHVAEFIADLDPFLAGLPDDFRYAVEIRNPEFLGPEYFACLRRNRVAHVLNAWTRMPEIQEQMLLPEVFTADFTVTRALLRRSRPYEQAVAQFSPYKKVQDPNPEARRSIRELIMRAEKRTQPAYIFVNNRLEGNAIETIESIVT
ncbi:MAG TPA: DUF72 domain-containing protein [Bryobacteraceae bacterium]|nr:DUF72 domain-containing protein [Bryobacteraceae bacterium]